MINQVSSGAATIAWDGEAAEATRDAITNNQDFQGYRIYKSFDRGVTWGEPLNDETGIRIGWIPIVQFDLEDGITGFDVGSRKSLGDDTGLVHSWTDNDVVDGFEYWYAVTTYDYDPVQDPLNPSFESSIGPNPNSDNVIAVIANSDPNGFVPGSIDDPIGGLVASSSLVPTVGNPNDGIVMVNVMDNRALGDFTYRISTTDTATYGETTFTNTLGVTLENLTSGQTLYQSVLPEDALYGTDLLPVREGVQVLVDSRFNVTDKDDRLDPVYPSVITPNSSYEMRYPDGWFQSSDTDSDDLTDVTTRLFPVRIDFDTTATQMAYTYTRGGYAYRSYNEFPGTAWDVSDPASPRQVNIVYTVQSGDATNGDNWDIDTNPSGGDSRHYSGILRSDYSGAAPDTAYTTGGTMDNYSGGGLDFVWHFWPGLTDTFTAAFPTTEAYLHGTSISFNYEVPIAPGIQYEFSTTAPAFQDSLVDMSEIMVVPNPYRVFADWDRNPNERKIQFTNLPPNSRVNIYTITGELVTSLDHGANYNSAELGTVEWNLWSYEFTEVAYGLYIYVVKTADGKYKKVGKFAIIR
jgi:hypothetical protein